MNSAVKQREQPNRGLRRSLVGAGVLTAGALTLAACGATSTSPKKTSAERSSTSVPTRTQPTVNTANVAGLGSVLVDGSGRTLYLLDSEAGAKVTCMAANGCTGIWPPAKLPAGVAHATAGGSARQSMLGTVTAPDGSLYLTYGTQRWPLYTFSGDSSAGQAHGQGIHSFGGTWWAISPSGTAVKLAVHSSSTSSSTSTGGGSYGGGGY